MTVKVHFADFVRKKATITISVKIWSMPSSINFLAVSYTPTIFDSFFYFTCCQDSDRGPLRWDRSPFHPETSMIGADCGSFWNQNYNMSVHQIDS